MIQGPGMENTQKVNSETSARKEFWMDGSLETSAGAIPRVRTDLEFQDRLGSWKARWGIGRMHYVIRPGLYAVGNPDQDSPVFVTANYKMSFDRLRSELGGLDGWIVVLDTKGINVWCAAGKGTFGTDEIVDRVHEVGLADVVAHRKLILPQLGAPGVRAHEVKKRIGFSITYGPVRAEDIPAFMEAGMKASPEMRKVTFPFRDRIVLIPMELVLGGKYLLFAAACFFLLSGLGTDGYSTQHVREAGLRAVAFFVLAFLSGAALVPALLPWLRWPSFSVKGAVVGVIIALSLGLLGAYENFSSAVAWCLIIPAVSSFLGMNFTGASTYTSLSGVKREMKVAVPIQAFCALAGIILWIFGRFV